MAVVYIVILIAVIVFVHEFGHYLAARIFHVKVISFSIGFGPKLFGFNKWGTNWDVRLLPLGGFVQMYGTEFEEVTDKEDPDYENAYNNKPIWQKVIINFAGPAFNLILPIPLLFCAYLSLVTTDYPATVGQIVDDSAAIGILEPGDRVLQIDGTPIRYWTQLHDIVADNPNKKLEFVIERAGKTENVFITTKTVDLRDAYDVMTDSVGRIGVTADQNLAIIGLTQPSSPAVTAGLKNFDEITAVNGKPVRTYIELEKAIREAEAGTLKLDILRPTDLNVEYGSVNILSPQQIVIDTDARSADALGIASASNFITQVDPGSPAAEAGLKAGDQILACNGAPVSLFRSTLDNMAQNWEAVHSLRVKRDGVEFDTKIQLQRLMITGEFQEEMPIIYAGMYSKIPTQMPDKIDKTFGDRLSFAASQSVVTTAEASTMLVVYIARMVQGRVSTKSLGGPILIGHMAQKAGEQGIESFLQMMAMISINLGIINLVPIPLLDGGKIFVLLIEAIKHGPISMRARQIIAYIGLAMVALLMLLAFKNDIERMWNLFFG